jgi:hypothetical protein
LLGVGDTMAKALAYSENSDWQERMIDRYGDQPFSGAARRALSMSGAILEGSD